MFSTIGADQEETLWASCASSLMMVAMMAMTSQPTLMMRDYFEKTVRYKFLNYSRTTNYFSEFIYVIVNNYFICLIHFMFFVFMDLIKNGNISIENSFWIYYGLFLINIATLSAFAVSGGIIMKNPAFAPVCIVLPEILGIIPMFLLDAGIKFGETLTKIIPFSKILMYNPTDTNLIVYYISSILWFIFFFVSGIFIVKKINLK